MLKELCNVIKWCVTGLQDYFNIQKVINVIHHVKRVKKKGKTESDQSMQKIYLIKVHTHS